MNEKFLNKGIIFDLDGTLVDTADDLMKAGNAFFTEMGFGCLMKKDEHKGIAIGGGRSMIKFGLEREKTKITEDILDHYYPKLLKHYEKCLVETSHVYPYVVDSLAKLIEMGWKLGICTNKPGYLAERLLEKLFLRKYFGVVVGSDTLPYRKPDPKTLIDTIELLGADRFKSILIGDSKTDRDTAFRAGVPIIMVKFGHGAINHDLSSLKPNAIVSSFLEIPDIAKSLIS